MRFIINIFAVMTGVFMVTLVGRTFAGEAETESSIVEVIQSLVYQSGQHKVAQTTTTLTRDCIPLENSRVPTLIQLGPGTDDGSYRLLAFPTECSDDIQLSSLLTSGNFDGDEPIILNKRHPICSFKMDGGGGALPNSNSERLHRKLNVIFFGQRSRGRTVSYTGTVEDRSACSDLCSSTPWDPFVQSVGIVDNENGRMVNDYVIIFSASNCTQELALEVGHETSLLNVTLVDGPNILVKSFVVINHNDALNLNVTV